MLHQDPNTSKFAPNKRSREVKSGHFVNVEPTPLPNPKQIIYSKSFAECIGLTDEMCRSESFIRYFSGDLKGTQEKGLSWATPYALSIYGQQMFQNCPFGNGNGYGDGRAISLSEIVLDNGERYEFQLKGAGKTPFSRTGDGRAVLRSSVREFLASEAMFHLGVSTTRAISLVGSSEFVDRPWYSATASAKSKSTTNIPTLDDPRVAHIPPEYRSAVIEQFASQFKQPDRMIKEQAAISCRVAPSFMRVGHIELFGRRALGEGVTPDSKLALEELKLIVDHAIFREFPKCQSVMEMLQEASRGIAKLTAEWIRVGFVQGNFNSDNCLVAGRTMDYGPFGFIEVFKPLWNMWTGGGEHFGFLNQHVAGNKNFSSLVHAVSPLLSEEEIVEAERLTAEHENLASEAVDDVWRRKMGLKHWSDESAKLVKALLPLMEKYQVDYTLFWRQLAHVGAQMLEKKDAPNLMPLGDCFYVNLDPEAEDAWRKWCGQWKDELVSQEVSESECVSLMQSSNPKYVPREWMLRKAYTAAQEGNYELVHELHALFEHPYDEQPEFESKYYTKAPAGTYAGLGEAGTAFMT